MTTISRLALLLVAVTALGTGCKKVDDEAPRLTGAEAGETMELTTSASAASALTADAIEISTDFTIGEGVEKAAEALRDFYRSQVPCAAVRLEGATVTIEYGVEGTCQWRGRTFSGTHAITIGRAEEAGVQVSHLWTAFSDGRVTVDGESTVDWRISDRERQVVHELTWTGPKGHTMTGAGDRTQTALEGDRGLRIDGTRGWTFDGRIWTLTIDGVEARPVDPVPQAGTYTIEDPKGRTLSLGFERVDEDVIKVTLTGPRGGTFSFRVRRSGSVDEA